MSRRCRKLDREGRRSNKGFLRVDAVKVCTVHSAKESEPPIFMSINHPYFEGLLRKYSTATKRGGKTRRHCSGETWSPAMRPRKCSPAPVRTSKKIATVRSWRKKAAHSCTWWRPTQTSRTTIRAQSCTGSWRCS